MKGTKDRYRQAARDNNLDVLKEATRQDCNSADEDGMTPVLWASFYGNLDALRVLMSRAGNPDKCDFWGNTALHLSAANGHMNCVTFLTNVGANIWLLDNDYHTALELAVLNGHDEIADFLDEISAQRMRNSKKTVQKFRERAVQLAQKNIKHFEKLRGQTSKRFEKEGLFNNNATTNGNKSHLSPSHASLTAPGSTLSLKKPQSRLTNPHAMASNSNQRMKHYSDYVSDTQSTTNGWLKVPFASGGTTRSGAVAKKAIKKKDESNVFYASSEADWDNRSIRSRAMSEPDYLNELDNEDTLRRKSTPVQQRAGLFERPGFGSVAFFGKPMANESMMALPKTPNLDTSDTQSLQRNSYHVTSSSPRRPQSSVASGSGKHFDTESIGTSGTLLRRMQRLPWSESEVLDLTEDESSKGRPADQMEVFLAAYDLTDLAASLSEEKIDLPALLLCSESDLQSIGLSLGPRRKLLDAIHKRKSAIQNPGLMQDTYF